MEGEYRPRPRTRAPHLSHPDTEIGSNLARPARWASDIAKFLESGKRARAHGLGPRKDREPERVVSWGMVGIKKSCEMKFRILPLTSQVT